MNFCTVWAGRVRVVPTQFPTENLENFDHDMKQKASIKVEIEIISGFSICHFNNLKARFPLVR